MIRAAHLWFLLSLSLGGSALAQEAGDTIDIFSSVLEVTDHCGQVEALIEHIHAPPPSDWNYPVFGEDAERLYLGEVSEHVYKGERASLPREVEAVNHNQTETLERVLVAVTRDGYDDLVVQMLFVRKEVTHRDDGVDVVSHSVTPQLENNWKTTREDDETVFLKRSAPAFSMMDTRSWTFELNKKTGQGKARLKFYHGGWLGHSSYSDDTYHFTLKPVEKCEHTAENAPAESNGLANGVPLTGE